jgi:hypothetical protein
MSYPEDAPRHGQVSGGLGTVQSKGDEIIAAQVPYCKTLFDHDVFILIVHPGEIVEVRIMGVDGKKGMVLSGYFDNHEAFCKAVKELEKRQHTGIYFTLQVIDSRLLARAYNRIKPSVMTTSDRDVLFYRWLPIDLDPVRPAGVSSSDSELKAALDLRDPIEAYIMKEIGSPAPLRAMSGNGGHLLFRLPDWPADTKHKAIIKGMLEDISARFSTPQVGIDTTVFNPARIWKLYGTTARKGDDVPESPYREARPHRLAYIDDLGGAV